MYIYIYTHACIRIYKSLYTQTQMLFVCVCVCVDEYNKPYQPPPRPWCYGTAMEKSTYI